jgi:hypothetical protein
MVWDCADVWARQFIAFGLSFSIDYGMVKGLGRHDVDIPTEWLPDRPINYNSSRPLHPPLQMQCSTRGPVHPHLLLIPHHPAKLIIDFRLQTRSRLKQRTLFGYSCTIPYTYLSPPFKPPALFLKTGLSSCVVFVS